MYATMSTKSIPCKQLPQFNKKIIREYRQYSCIDIHHIKSPAFQWILYFQVQKCLWSFQEATSSVQLFWLGHLILTITSLGLSIIRSYQIRFGLIHIRLHGFRVGLSSEPITKYGSEFRNISRDDVDTIRVPRSKCTPI